MSQESDYRYYAFKQSTNEKRGFKNMRDLNPQEFEADARRKFAEEYETANEEMLLDAELNNYEVAPEELWIFVKESKSASTSGLNTPKYFAFCISEDGMLYGVTPGIKSPRGAITVSENKRRNPKHEVLSADRDNAKQEAHYKLALALWNKMIALKKQRTKAKSNK